MKSKKGLSHVEVIISFFIFVGFVLFLFVIINPFKKNISDDVLNSALLNIDENLTTNISTVSINLNNSADITNIYSKGCFEIDLFPAIDCNSNRNVIVKDINGKILNANLDLIQHKLLISATTNSFYTIYCSEEIIPQSLTQTDCPMLDSENYSLGIINFRSLWSNSKLLGFNQSYYNDYPNLKAQIVPQGTEFGLIVTDINGNVYTKNLNTIPKGISVKSNTLPVDILYNNATTLTYAERVYVW